MTLKDTNEMFVDDLRDPAYAAGYLNITLEDDGIEGFLYALQKVARAHGISKVASTSDIPRESLYRSLSDKGNPSVKTLTRVLESLGMHLTITSSVQESCTAEAGYKIGQVQEESPTGQMSGDMEKSVTELCTRLEKEFAATHERAREEQEQARRATLELQEEGRRVLAQIEQVAAIVTKQVQMLQGRATLTDRVQVERSSTYSFPTRAGGQTQINANLYQENPLKLVKGAA